MNVSRIRRAAICTAAMIAMMVAAALGATPATASGDRPVANARWSAAWTTAHHHAFPGFDPSNPSNWSEDGFADESLRQVIRSSAGGSHLRIRLTNRFGTTPLRITGATIGKTTDGAEIRPGTLRRVTFDHQDSTTIPVGAEAKSAAVRLRTRPLEKLTVTLYFAEPTGPATFHEGGFTTTYRAEGDHRFDHGAAAYAGETSHSWYYLKGVDVAGGPGRPKGTVVAFGDSITDGAFSTPNADNRYPDELAERLVAAGIPMSVVNAGINGNKLLADSTCFGEAGVTRFERDVLDQPRVRTAIVLLGVNDIGGGGMADFGCGSSPVVTAEQLIEGHRALIRSAHDRGITIIGATITPFKGNEYGYDTPHNEAVRDAVNHWIRTSGEYDAVVDFDRALADPDNPDAMLPAYDGGDALHPNDAGMKAMADAIDLADL